MATLNVSLPEQLKNWVGQQVENGNYSSASDYLRDLIREDIRHKQHEMQWLADYLKPLAEAPDEEFLSVSADDIKARARQKLKV